MGSQRSQRGVPQSKNPLGHFSRFVRPGFVRVDLPGVDDLDGLMASAYENTEDARLVVVVINADDTPHSVALNVPGREGACLRAFLTDADRDLSEVEPARAGVGYTIPARGLVTFTLIP